MTGFKRTTMWNADHTHGCGLPGCDCYTKLSQYEDSGLTPERAARYSEVIKYADQRGIPQALIFSEIEVFDKLIKSTTDSIDFGGENVSKWIPVKQRLPKQGKEVLIYCYNPFSGYPINYRIRVSKMLDLNGEYWDSTSIPPSHWMPLPKPPK